MQRVPPNSKSSRKIEKFAYSKYSSIGYDIWYFSGSEQGTANEQVVADEFVDSTIILFDVNTMLRFSTAIMILASGMCLKRHDFTRQRALKACWLAEKQQKTIRIGENPVAAEWLRKRNFTEYVKQCARMEDKQYLKCYLMHEAELRIMAAAQAGELELWGIPDSYGYANIPRSWLMNLDTNDYQTCVQYNDDALTLPSWVSKEEDVPRKFKFVKVSFVQISKLWTTALAHLKIEQSVERAPFLNYSPGNYEIQNVLNALPPRKKPAVKADDLSEWFLTQPRIPKTITKDIMNKYASETGQKKPSRSTFIRAKELAEKKSSGNSA